MTPSPGLDPTSLAAPGEQALFPQRFGESGPGPLWPGQSHIPSHGPIAVPGVVAIPLPVQ